MAILSKIFGDANARYLKKISPLVVQINIIEEKLAKLSDEKLKKQSRDLKLKINEEKLSFDNALPYAFSLVREAARRTLKQRHFDEQIMGGVVLHQGQIIEMKTGEGKTLCATLAVYLNALTGKGTHVVTVNDYLARRDTVWMGQIYHFLGLSIGCIQQQGQSFLYDPEWRGDTEDPSSPRLRRASTGGTGDTGDEKEGLDLDKERDELGSFKIVQEFLRPCARKEAYEADITYGTNNEFGFDYLRDNMVYDLKDKSQRGHHYAIIDEIDSILIDEARTPLIISQPDEISGRRYQEFAQLVPKLQKDKDFNVDEKMRAVTLTEQGINKVEGLLGIKDIYAAGDISLLHHLEQALQAEILYKKDKDYIVKDGRLIIVDEFTGRLMPDRRYSEGLHQALEAKEGLEVRRESRTLATITFQNYFRLYQKLAGMTGTAATSSEEFHKVYKLDVVLIPTHKPMIRKDLSDRIYQTETGKFKALVREIKGCHQKGQPVLVGTISIEKNELLSSLLTREGIPHQVLNAKQHEKEAQIIAQAGREGAITVATNMAGRGVDIMLGGVTPSKIKNKKQKIKNKEGYFSSTFEEWEKEHDKIVKLGGLFVIGTERHEARRIDNQLRGRSGRQGDSGASQFFVSLEDDLMRVFGSERIKNLMGRFGIPEDQPIENKIVSRAIESAQAKIEGFHFDIRKHVLEYDDVMNIHRETIYRKRNDILSNKNPENIFEDYIKQEIEEMIKIFLPEKDEKLWNFNDLSEETKSIFMIEKDIYKSLTNFQKADFSPQKKRARMKEYLEKIIQEKLQEKIKYFGEKAGKENLLQFCRMVLLGTLDLFWMEHLDGMSYLRESVRLRAYGQRDPLVEYKNEGYRLFRELLGNIRQESLKRIFHLEIRKEPAPISLGGQTDDLILSGAPKASSETKVPFELPGAVEEKKMFFDEGRPQTQKAYQIAQEIPPDFRKAGRNDKCPCGSGKKFKKCCWDKYR